jgi:hypothetical protein
MAISLNTGKVKIEIVFDKDDKDYIYFNPNDPNLYIRMKKFQENLDEYLKGIEDIELDDAGNPKSGSVLQKYEDFQNKLYEELDNAIGSPVSSVVFKKCSPFAIVDGDYFIMQFAEGIIPEIQKHQEKATKEAEIKMAKHISKYKK